MIIGIDASRAAKQNKTGVEWYAYHVIENLVKLDTSDQFVLYIQNEPDAWLKKIGERANVKVKRLRWPVKFLWTQGRLSLEMLLHPPQALFIPASAVPVIHPRNTVAAIHDVGFMTYPKVYGRWQRWYLKWSTKFAAKRAKTITTISEFSKRELVKYFAADHNKISVTPLGYDAAKFKIIENREEINNVLAKYNISQPFILSVGRLERKKNVDGLVKALAILQNTPFYSPPSQGGESRGYKLVLAGSPGYGWQEIEKIRTARWTTQAL